MYLFYLFWFFDGSDYNITKAFSNFIYVYYLGYAIVIVGFPLKVCLFILICGRGY